MLEAYDNSTMLKATQNNTFFANFDFGMILSFTGTIQEVPL